MKNTSLSKRGKDWPAAQPSKADVNDGSPNPQAYGKNAAMKKGGAVARPLTPVVRKAAEKADDAFDKKRGIKEGSPRDMRLDKKRGVPEDAKGRSGKK